MDRVRGLEGVEHVIVVDEDGDLTSEPQPDGFDFDAAWRAVEPDDLLTLIYTSRHHRPAEGRPDHARQHGGHHQRLRAR